MKSDGASASAARALSVASGPVSQGCVATSRPIAHGTNGGLPQQEGKASIPPGRLTGTRQSVGSCHDYRNAFVQRRPGV